MHHVFFIIPIILLTFLPSCVESCQMLSDYQSRLHLHSCPYTVSPHILLLISNWSLHPVKYPFYSAGSKFCVEILLVIIPFRVCYMVVKYVMSRQFLTPCSLLSFIANTLFLWLASHVPFPVLPLLNWRFFVTCLWAYGNALSQ